MVRDIVAYTAVFGLIRNSAFPGLFRYNYLIDAVSINEHCVQ